MRPATLIARAFAIAIACAQPANAEYAVTGKFEGNFCTSYLIFSQCALRAIDATVDSKGALFTLTTDFHSVDEFNNDLCWVKVRNSWFNWLISDIPVFYGFNNGDRSDIKSYTKLGTPDYIVFRCSKK